MTTLAMEEDVFTGKVDFALWRKMWRFARPHRSKLFTLMALGFIVSWADMALPYLTGRIVDAVTLQGANLHLRRFLLAYAGVILWFITCIFSFIMVAGRITVSVSYDIRETCFDKLQRLPFSYYDRKAVGWLMARMTSDCSNLSRIMGWALLDLSWGTSALINSVIMMTLLAWRREL